MTTDIRTALQSSDSSHGAMPEDAAMLGRLLSGRFSCRGFMPDPVPRHVIERMLAMAQLSPSWCNSQPWQVIVTSGLGTERLREALFAHAEADCASNGGAPATQPDFPFPAAYRGVYRERQREVGWQLYQSVGARHGDREASAVQALKNFRLFDAPHMLLITSERDLGAYGAIDCGIYLSTVLLAGQSLGVASVAQAALAAYSPFMRAYFNIPDHRVIVAGASFGYADTGHPANAFRSRRAALAEVVEWVTN
ncbi:p-nitrobenzoate reductase (plasmid) [Cupriavidus necator N-1]|uniref:p-nitrobenzoate reductase n=1 Tax=Cupriavidus necator (strain ATCC 43291 / DSM 13513 / CCUG 52238 / LMG 8453 / N-1) TaxID=1042878 RepID=F8GWU8_CUPNN|nr:nitroreductase [Cupriavidus necator]AEI81818.1 p-nitrobenzoate reductase [Cupriavidus necator N-1]MDX6008148.1 nitroreductase [Cupriavidus necator]